MQNIPIGPESLLCTPCESSIIEKQKTDQNPSGLLLHEHSLVIKAMCEYFKSCTVEGCPLNSAYTHMISFYSNILFCVTHHKTHMFFGYGGYFKNICDFEKMILLSVHIDRTFKPAQIGVFDLQCEQDIESLVYRLYEHLYVHRNKDITAHDYYFILEILLYRKEYERFFTIYNELNDRTIGIYKLAIITSLQAKKDKIPRILSQIRNALSLPDASVDEMGSFSDKKYRNLVENAAHDSPIPLSTPDENLLLYYTIKHWYLDKYKKHHWDMSINMWNISKNVEGASEAMIDRCIRHRKYEEGWYIYKESLSDTITPLRMFRLSRRIMSLIVHAINNCNTNMWVEHYLEIATVMSRLNIETKAKIKNTFTVLLNLKNYSHISCIAGLIIKQYPEDLLYTSESLGIILYDVYEIFKEHESIIIGEIEKHTLEGSHLQYIPELAKYALISYKFWRKKNSRGIFVSLFWGRSKESIEIYTLILHIAMIIKNKSQIIDIFHDIWNDSIQVTDSLSFSLTYIHGTYTSCPCTLNANSRGYLMHVLSLLTQTQ